VVDANVAAKWFLVEEHADIAEDVFRSSYILTAPDLLVSELGSIFREKVLRRELTLDRAAQALSITLGRVELVRSEEAFSEALAIATSSRASFYDSLYVAHAVNLGLRFVTADSRLSAALAGRFDSTLWALREFQA
jgi:predicted nucleic acid-binding protein